MVPSFVSSPFWPYILPLIYLGSALWRSGNKKAYPPEIKGLWATTRVKNRMVITLPGEKGQKVGNPKAKSPKGRR